MITIVLGNRLRELRSKTGLSQEKFALKIGMDRTYYASVEAENDLLSLLLKIFILNIFPNLNFTFIFY